jgi:hypothetical protein
MLVCALSLSNARETAGAARIRHSLRPLNSRAKNFMQASGGSRREIVNSYLAVIVREGG